MPYKMYGIMHGIKTTQRILTRSVPKKPEHEVLHFSIKHNMLETEVIIRFQGAFSTGTQMLIFFFFIVLDIHLKELQILQILCNGPENKRKK